MKTILHVSKYYTPHLGGIESVASQIVEGLKDYHNIVLCFSSDRRNHVDIVDGVMVFRVAVWGTISSQAIAPMFLWRLRKIIQQYSPDAVHLHCPNPFVYPIVLRTISTNTKLVIHWHSDVLGKRMLYRAIRPLETRILHRADAILATSPTYLDHSLPLSPFKNKTFVLPNGIDTQRFLLRSEDDQKVHTIRNLYDQRPIVLFVGRHIPYKGIDRLIKAEPLIHHGVQIVIAGAGPCSNELMKMAETSSRIHFVGALSESKLRCYLHAASIFAFPSVNKAEAFGVALAEAMYCYCVPVVFSLPESGVNWVTIKDITGMEVPLNDVSAFAKAIDTLLDNPLCMQNMSSAAHNRVVDNFTDSVIYQSVVAFYNNLFTT